MSQAIIFKFRLYVAGNTQNSLLARTNLAKLCETNLPDRHEIEVVDVFKAPERALADGVLMTPTLLKLSPPPNCRIVGTLSQTLPVLLALGLTPLAA